MTTIRKVVKEVTQEERDRLARFEARPSLDECLSLHDFEVRFTPLIVLSTLSSIHFWIGCR